MNLNLRKAYATDEDKAQHGTWVPAGGDLEGVEFKIARSDNKKAAAMRKALMAPYEAIGGRRNLLSGRQVPEDEQRKINVQVVAHCILLDWKGVKNEAGEAVPYSPEVGIEALDDMPDLLNDLLLAAMNQELFRAQNIEATAKN